MNDPVARQDQEDMQIREYARRVVIFYEELRKRGIRRLDITPFLIGWIMMEYSRERDEREKED